MDKATMLYNKFKSMFLVGEGDCVLSQVLNKSLAEQRQHEEAKKGALKRVEQVKETVTGTVYNRASRFIFHEARTDRQAFWLSPFCLIKFGFSLVTS